MFASTSNTNDNRSQAAAAADDGGGVWIPVHRRQHQAPTQTQPSSSGVPNRWMALSSSGSTATESTNSFRTWNRSSEDPFQPRQMAGSGTTTTKAEAPSAFRSKTDTSAEDRRRQREDAARFAERERAAKREAEQKEAKKIADALNFTSEETYPSLGGGGGGAASRGGAWSSAAPMDFKQTVLNIVEQERMEQQMQAEANLTERQRRRRNILGSHSLDDINVPSVVRRRAARNQAATHTGPTLEELEEQKYSDTYLGAPAEEEDDYGAYDYSAAPQQEEPSEEDTGEWNADILARRRKGDKGVW